MWIETIQTRLNSNAVSYFISEKSEMWIETFWACFVMWKINISSLRSQRCGLKLDWRNEWLIQLWISSLRSQRCGLKLRNNWIYRVELLISSLRSQRCGLKPLFRKDYQVSHLISSLRSQRCGLKLNSLRSVSVMQPNFISEKSEMWIETCYIYD